MSYSILYLIPTNVELIRTFAVLLVVNKIANENVSIWCGYSALAIHQIVLPHPLFNQAVFEDYPASSMHSTVLEVSLV